MHQLLRRSPYLDARTRWELDLSAGIVNHRLVWVTDGHGSRRLTGCCPHCHHHSRLDLHPASYEIPTNDGDDGVVVTLLTCQRCRYGTGLRVCVPLGGG